MATADKSGIPLNITTPTLILDENRVRRNIARMASKARDTGVAFRPHFKTHQSAVIGSWFRDEGVDAIAVSSLSLARYFAEAGWTDITVAIPVNLREMATITALADDVKLGLLLESSDALSWLRAGLRHKARLWIKVDSGYGRSGISWKKPELVLALAKKIRETPQFEFAGILTHSGQSYEQRDIEGLLRIHAETLACMASVKQFLADGGIGTCRVSIGDTPTCSVAIAFPGVDEIRPGNFVFYDLMQKRIGSCRDEDIAVALACPVVGKTETTGSIILYGGAAHLSKDFIVDDRGRTRYGYLAKQSGPDTLGVPDRGAPVVSLSQEHGVVALGAEHYNDIRLGDVVMVLPAHSCLTANLHGHYMTLAGIRIDRFRFG